MNLDYLPGFITVLLFSNYCCLATGISQQNCTKEDFRTLRCNYIPKNIPEGISRVRVLKFMSKNLERITLANFSSLQWRNVQYLEFGSQEKSLLANLVFQEGCFVKLTSLQELRLHIKWLHLSPDVFLGLDSVETLDLSGCSRLSFDQIIHALNGSHKLPALKKLALSQKNNVRGAYSFNDSFVEILLPRNITSIDMSASQISMVNITSIATKLKHLEVLNTSYSVIGDIFDHHLKQSDIQHLKSLDFSWATLPVRSMPLVAGKIIISDITVMSSELHPSNKLFLTPQMVNSSGVIHKYTSFWVKNCTVTIDKDLQWYTEDFVVQQNNLKRLDIRTICNEYNMSSLRRIDFSKNEMEYLHPSLLHCMPNLEGVDLSRNKLYLMVKENFSLFESMFSKLPQTKYISLAANSLDTIPSQLFVNSNMVEIIDLSSNQLDQVTFVLNNLDHLLTLDLGSNNIKNLDSMSISHLKSIPSDLSMKNYSTKVIFTSNPISCSECAAKHFLSWLISTNITDVRSQNLTCTREDGKKELINESTLHLVQKICVRKTILLAGTVSGSVMLALIIILSSVLFIRKRRVLKLQNRANVINRLREGQGQHEFVAYLAYSSDDQDFVTKYVLDQLSENLQLMTGIDRELICTGDVHLRFGFDIHSETIRCIERSSVVIIVVSRNFCTSEYCRYELDEAYIRRKPIVLMFKERIEEEAMMPTMKELYRKNVRMLWSFENGEYVLKSSWDNVCISVLDLVPCDV